MKRFTYKTEFGKEDEIWFHQGQYWDGNYAVQAWCDDGPYAHITVNLNFDGDEHLLDRQAYFNIGDGLVTLMIAMVEDGLVEQECGEFKVSGRNTYPLVKFTDKFLEYCE